jgi:serine protease Do
LGDPQGGRICHDGCMTSELLTSFSNSIADAIAAAAPGVVQVQGRRRPASGLTYGTDTVVTTLRAIGREDGLHVRRDDGTTLDAELAGWDPTTSLAVLRVAGLAATAIAPASALPRVGHLAIGVARSWSNAVTGSTGVVAVVGGPLRTGRRRAIDQVIRTTAPVHDGFAGGALLDTAGSLLGVVTSTQIRGTTVVIPASIAWKAAANILEHGRLKRGYLGIAGQPVQVPDPQHAAGRAEALLIVSVTPGSPAAAAGLMVGDILTELDGQPVESPEDLLDLLLGDRVGRPATLGLLRGGTSTRVPVTVGERPTN